jgi:hypothetical protein
VVELGPNHRVWQRLTTATDLEGVSRPETNSAIELCPGVGRYDDGVGGFAPASAELGLTESGHFVARLDFCVYQDSSTRI